MQGIYLKEKISSYKYRYKTEVSTEDKMSTKDKTLPSGINAFSYSDYLGMYLYIGLIAHEDDIYKRVADVMQVTMSEKVGVSGFEMKNAKT